jgi:hypothetical protein
MVAYILLYIQKKERLFAQQSFLFFGIIFQYLLHIC